MASSVAAMSAWAGTSALSSSHSSSSPSSPCHPAVLLRKTGSAFRLAPPQGFSSNLSTVRRKGSSSHIRAAAPPDDSVPDGSKQVQEFFYDLRIKYDAMENKSTVWIYGGGTLVALWLASSILGAINTLPLFPKVLEFIGICYTGWFIYRYVLFKSSRKQLASDIEDLKLKITGTGVPRTDITGTGVPRSAFYTEDDE